MWTKAGGVPPKVTLFNSLSHPGKFVGDSLIARGTRTRISKSFIHNYLSSQKIMVGAERLNF